MQRFAQKPGVRLIMPFYKTLVNIFFETGKRSPLAWAMPSVRKDLLSKDPHVKQMAYSRMVTGFGLMLLAYEAAYNPAVTPNEKPRIVLTGMPPVDKKRILSI